MIAASCLLWDINCETLIKGGLVIVVAFILFVGSVLLLLASVFGRRMGYLVLAVSFFGWMMILSSVWTFGFYSQGPETPVNLGPRGTEPGWVVESAGIDPDPVYEVYATYPDGAAWRVPGTNDNDTGSEQSVTTATQGFLANQTNEELGAEANGPGSVSTTDFTVENVRFATDGDVSLAAATAYFTDGGAMLRVYLRHDTGSVDRYSWMFLIGSTVLFAAHIPFLDRAERNRKAILTGGTAPPWYGPA